MLKLPDLVVGAAGRHRAVTVLPLFAPMSCAPIAYRLGAQAIAEGALEIREVGGGTVDRLLARNRSADRVLLLEGDHLIGAKQNRVLTSSAMIGGRRKVALPVSCVEQGRWSCVPSGAAASPWTASAGVRRILKLSVTRSLLGRRDRAADQAWIWSQIADQQRRLHVSSATCALAHTYASRAGDLASASARLLYAADASGLAIGIGDELVSIDLFDRPATCAFYWRRLVEGAALEALGARVGGGIADTDVQRAVDRIRAASWTPVVPVADGEELRARAAEFAASALLVDGRLVHLGLATGLASPSAAALEWTPRPMRRDLPDSLARRYTIVARVGVGGAKEVFHATDLRDGRSVAIARVPGIGDRAEFAREVELLRRVRSRHVPEIYDSLVDAYEDGYIVMEYCDGENLAQLADRPLTAADAGPILVQLARGLAAIHQAHVLHRDIKPENVVLCSRGDRLDLKIVDFGLSRRASSVSTNVESVDLGGTLPYLAPEVLRGDPIDARSDVYSFAACCFRLLVGEVPLAPADRESQFDYLLRLRDVERHDLAPLPALPPPAGELLARMLDPDPRRRPFMPEVVAGFERAFGTGAIPARSRTSPAPRAPALARSHQLEVPIAAPDRLVVAACRWAPLIALVADGEGTVVRALAADGSTRWSRRVDAALTTGLRADLDGDGVREVYLAGPDRLIALDATGAPRFDAPAPPRAPSLLAIPHGERPRLALDGRLLDPRTGADTGAIPRAYQGSGRELFAATCLRGVSYNGFAAQAFRGAHATAAAIVAHAGARAFRVALLEERGRRVELAVYGPGGARVDAFPVADCPVPTGDLIEIVRMMDPIAAPLFGAEHSPIAALAPDGGAVAIVCLLGASPLLTASLVAFALPPLDLRARSPHAARGRELWRTRLDAAGGGALLADIAGAGRPALVVGDGASVAAFDPWTGEQTMSFPCAGRPVAFGDPFATGFAHLVTASPEGIELWRGPRWRPGIMQWAGPRADLWRSGTLRADGSPYGPV